MVQGREEGGGRGGGREEKGEQKEGGNGQRRLAVCLTPVSKSTKPLVSALYRGIPGS